MSADYSRAAGTGSSVVVTECQVCSAANLRPVLFLGYLPPVNRMNTVGDPPREQPGYPAQLLYCQKCHLAQLGLTVDPQVLFPAEYPYTSSTTKILRDNFAQLYQECAPLLGLRPSDLVVDVGSNDGNLLSNFVGKHRVLGITPEDIGRLAIERGIPTLLEYFGPAVVDKVLATHGPAALVTATNVFAHIERPNDVLRDVMRLVAPGGTFISESHYLLPLIQDLQYDTVYHEHLRYYSLHSLKYLLESQGLEVFHAVRLPTHGGSIRVYAARRGERPVSDAVGTLLTAEAPVVLSEKAFAEFRRRVLISKLQLQSLILTIKQAGHRIYGISAPSRASTLVNYVGLDDGMIDTVLEVAGSYKTGKYMPGTIIPVEDEARLFRDQPEYALLFSWHIADELIPKLTAKGFNGRFIVPLPEPRIV